MKSKQFIAGVLVGAIVSTGVGVYASGALVEATKTNDTSIFVDGKKLELEEGYSIINYEGRVYTSTRAVAEALGANVNYKVDNYGKAVMIESPSTPTPSPTPSATPKPTATPEPTATPTPKPTIDYRLPPVRSSGLGNTVEVYSANVPIDRTVIKVDLTNNNNEGTSIYNYNQFKLIDENGKEYACYVEKTSASTIFYDSIPNNANSTTTGNVKVPRQTLEFPKLPAGTKVTLSMPLQRIDVGGKIENYDIRIPLIIEEYDTTTIQ